MSDTRTTLAALLALIRESTSARPVDACLTIILSSAGATADLFDLSCLSEKNNDLFNQIQDIAYACWSNADVDLEAILPKPPLELGKHFFQTNANGGISPVWDFRGDSAPNQPDAFVVAAKVGDLLAPTGSQDVDWLQLKGVSGALASVVYRTDTRGGQPPASVRYNVNSIFS